MVHEQFNNNVCGKGSHTIALIEWGGEEGEGEGGVYVSFSLQSWVFMKILFYTRV